MMQLNNTISSGNTTQTITIDPEPTQITSSPVVHSNQVITNNAPNKNEQKPYALTYWEEVAKAIDVGDKLLNELKNTRTPDLVNFASRFAEAIAHTSIGGINVVTNGLITPSAMPGYTQMVQGLYHGVLAAYVAKGIFDGAMKIDSLEDAHNEIEKGLEMMEQMNDANIDSSEKIASHLESIKIQLKNEIETLQTLQLDIEKMAQLAGVDIKRQERLVAANVEILEKVHFLLKSAAKKNEEASENIQDGIDLLESCLEVTSEKFTETEIAEHIESLKKATAIFMNGINLTTESNELMHQGINLQHELIGKLQKETKETVRELKHEKEQKEKIAEELGNVIKEKKVTEQKVDETIQENKKMKKRLHRQKIVGIKTSKSLQKAKEQANYGGEHWGMMSTLAGVTGGIVLGGAGLATGGIFGGGTGGFTGFYMGGEALHEARKKAKEEKNKFVAKVEVKDPQHPGEITIKFAPSTTAYNWISPCAKIIADNIPNKINFLPEKTGELWKDSKTQGGFKILIGTKVHEGIFQKQEEGLFNKNTQKGALSFEEQMKLFDSLVTALEEGDITGSECKALINSLNAQVLVPCERYEGEISTISLQLIDKGDCIFSELLKEINLLEKNNLGNSILTSQNFNI